MHCKLPNYGFSNDIEMQENKEQFNFFGVRYKQIVELGV